MLALAIVACKATPPLSPEAERGRQVYQSNCTACHNSDPALPGSLGPEVKGSSRALLEARILRAEYPAGYTPKRETRIMQALPALQDDVPAIAEYLR
jgi:mono/diheme cytochrome c family protein